MKNKEKTNNALKGATAINGIARKSAIGAVIASSLLLGAYSPIKSEKQDKTPQQTELMSKESAEALKVNSLQQSIPVPTVHNKKLDEMILAFADNEQERKSVIDWLNNLYEDYGTYSASAIIQHGIDSEMFSLFLNDNRDYVKKFPYSDMSFLANAAAGELNGIDAQKDTIMQWIETYHGAIFAPVISSFSQKPNAKEFITALDNYVKKDEFGIFGNDYATYYRQSETRSALIHAIIKKFRPTDDDTQYFSAVIAEKIYQADLLVFRLLLKKRGVLVKNASIFVNCMRIVDPVVYYGHLNG